MCCQELVHSDIRTCLYIYSSKHIHTYLRTYVHMYMCTYLRMSMGICICSYLHMHGVFTCVLKVAMDIEGGMLNHR